MNEKFYTMQKNHKYKILAKLEEMPPKQARLAQYFLCRHLEITKRTFQNYMHAKEGSKYQIPGDHLVQISSFFGVAPVQLYTQAPQSLHLLWIKEQNQLNQLQDV